MGRRAAWTVRCAYPGCDGTLSGTDPQERVSRHPAVAEGWWAELPNGLGFVCVKHNPKARTGEA